MKLKYRTGYFISVMIAIFGFILSMANIDPDKYILFAGAAGVAFFVIYYFISDYNKEYNWRQLRNLGACIFIVLLLTLHFALYTKLDYFIIVGILLIKPDNKKIYSKLKIESND